MDDENRFINIYNKKVKVTGWNEDESRPHDYDPYNHCKRNYFLSTHLRYGNDLSQLPTSTTREMQQQILSRGIMRKHCEPARAMATQGSLKGSCKYLMREGKGVYPMDDFITDYVTTNKYDYRHPNPHSAIPFEVIQSPPPPTFRKVSFCARTPTSKFLDEPLSDASKCYPDHKKLPPYVNVDLYYGLNKNAKTDTVEETHS